jgi:tripartite-type tricarboxylate transporter receptor subunit TctC
MPARRNACACGKLSGETRALDCTVSSRRLFRRGCAGYRPEIFRIDGATLPELPRVAEAGVPGFEISGWLGLSAPASTPRDVVAVIHRELARALNDRATHDYFVKQGADPVGSTPEACAAFIARQIAKWNQVAAQAKMTPQ